MAATGIPVLTHKGKEALKHAPPDLSPLCRNILVQVDGKRSLDDVLNLFRGLKGLEESMQKLFAGHFIQATRDCHDLVKSMVQQMLGPKAPTLLKKIDDMQAAYGDACWEHLDELEKTARMFYGEVVATDLKSQITRLVQESKK